nr:hypothetical protein BaRGS_006702 [Batillaria attramentaria]
MTTLSGYICCVSSWLSTSWRWCFFVAAYVFGLILCCWRISRWAYVAGLCAYIAAFSVAAAIAFFHGAEYLERNKLTEPEFYKQWSSTIKDGTRRSYGWSYALGWVGMILAAFTATFYSLAGCYITSQRYEDRERLEKESTHRGRDYPIAMEPRNFSRVVEWNFVCLSQPKAIVSS